MFIPAIIYSQQSFTLVNDLNVLYNNSFENNKIDFDAINKLKSELNKIAASTNEAAYFFADKEDIIDLSHQFEEVSRLYSQTDSLHKVIYPVYLNFAKTFNKYFVSRLNNSPKKKIVFLITSISCECTLEMCRNQLMELTRFIILNEDEYELIVEDTWTNSYFKEKYSVGFIPTTIFLDENQNEMNRFVRENFELIKKGKDKYDEQ
jgi:hypothetical protein